jgi:hypothetical protein
MELEKALEQRAAAKEEAEMANARLAALPRLFPGASSLHEARLQFDSMGARATAAEAIVRETERIAPEVVARARAAAGSQGKTSNSTDK